MIDSCLLVNLIAGYFDTLAGMSELNLIGHWSSAANCRATHHDPSVPVDLARKPGLMSALNPTGVN